jgi:hypothetical protein
MQANPGDWEVIVSQRPIAIHAAEYKGTSDRGVVMLRRQLRRLAEAVAAGEAVTHRPAAADGIVPTWTSNTVLRVPARPGHDDEQLLRHVGRQVRDAVIAADDLAGAARFAAIQAALEKVRADLA